MDLTFGEQVKIILSRKNMTIKELAELFEEETGKKMSRQNMTQRLGRDNFQEKDMRIIAKILGCRFRLNILDDNRAKTAAKERRRPEEETRQVRRESPARTPKETVCVKSEEEKERDITVGEIMDMMEKIPQSAQRKYAPDRRQKETVPQIDYSEPEDLERGELNPATGHEYESNMVRKHPSRIGFVQVYDRSEHGWTDMTEWAFLGFQERKKALLGKEYEPPIYLD